MAPEQSSSKIGKSVGEKLRAARVAQHYTQSQLAAPDFSVSYISAIERGQIHPSLRALEILAARLGLTSTQLLPNRSQADDRPGSALSITERDDEEIELVLLEAQIFILQSNADQTVTLLEKLSTKRLKRQHQVLHRYLLGWAYYKTEQFPESETMLAEGAQMAKELSSQYLQLRILNQLAKTHVAMRNYAQALLAHQRCLNVLESTDLHDPFFTTEVYMHMGQHYTRLENYIQALEMFNKALSMTDKLTNIEKIEKAYWDLGHYYADQKEFDLATLYVFKSSQMHDQEMSKRLQSEIYHYLGHALMKSDPQQAGIYLDEAFEKQSVLHDPLTLSSLSTRKAEWLFNHGSLKDADQFAHRACEVAQPYGDTLILAEALIILGRIEYAQQCYTEGDQHFVAGLDMLARLDNHEELSDESVRYAQLLEEIGKEHEAFTHFRRAFQSRQKFGK